MRGAPHPALFTGAALLTPARGGECLQTLFIADEHVAVEVAWGVYRQLMRACSGTDRKRVR